MAESQVLLQKIVEGIQEKKGKRIAIIDMTKLDTSACPYFVVCEGDSTTHTDAVANSVVDYVQEKINDKPLHKDGFKNSQWIALDYGDVMVHVFQREPREYYSIESLWADAKVTWIDDIN